jgi:uncharacterized protein
VRSLDWPLPVIGAATRIFRFVDEGHEFVTVGFPGFVGVLSGMIPGAYSVTINWAPPPVGRPKFDFAPPFLLREVLQDCHTYDEAVYALKHTVLSTSVFFTVCGKKQKQACIIERIREEAVVRKMTGSVLVQANHHVGRKFKANNDVMADAECEEESMLKDSVDRAESLKKALQKAASALQLEEVAECLGADLVQNELTVQKMAFCPKTGEFRAWRLNKLETQMERSETKIFDEIYEERRPKFSETINIAVVGKVSSGKSSLLNAIMLRDRSNPIVEVGATSGVTTKVRTFRLDDHVLIIDSPGLDDIRNENSDETNKLLKNIDLGILVVTGSADGSQKKNYDDLKTNANKVVVVLNKIDVWDDLDESALNDVLKQWHRELGINHIYPTCTKGFDPKTRRDAPMDIRGIEELNQEIWGFLQQEGKDLLLARHLGDKRKFAAGIISASLVAVAAEAFIPGSAAYISATQALAITALYYLYTGKILPKASAFALLPTFAGESIGINVFLWVKSLLPPTGVIDIAAAGVAIGITFAMLAAVNYVFSSGFEIDQKEMFKEKFNQYQKSTVSDVKKRLVSTIKEGGSIKEIVYRILFK